MQCIKNAHDIREACGYLQESRKTFGIPSIAGAYGNFGMGSAFVILHLHRRKNRNLIRPHRGVAGIRSRSLQNG